MSTAATILFTLSSCAILFKYSFAATGDIGFITAGDTLYTISMDTQVIQKLPVANLNFPAGIEFDRTGGRIYWAEYWGNKIGRCDTDGGNPELNFVTGTNQPYGLAIDVVNQWLYWSAEENILNSVLERVKLDGSQRSVIANIGPSSPRHLALDTTQNKIYWSDLYDHGIRRVNIDGSGSIETILDASMDTSIGGITLDIQAGLLFWCDWGRNTIESLNLATNQGNIVYQSPSDISPYALALYEQDIYWVDSTLPYLQKIPRAGLQPGQVPQNYGTSSNPFPGANGLKIILSVCSTLGQICLNGGTCVNEPSGQDLFTCQCTASYQGRLCEELQDRRKCETPPLPQNGFISDSEMYVGTSIRFICLDGYVIVGASQATCREDLTWSVEPPTCARSCPDLTPPVNGGISPAQGPYLSGQLVTFHCNSGYHLVGLGTISCTSIGLWSSNSFPSCSEIVATCPPPNPPFNGYVIPQQPSYEVDQAVTFQCNNGYDLSGAISAFCQVGGTWSAPTPTCQSVSCSPPQSPIQGSFQPVHTTYSIGQQVDFICNEGYNIVAGQQSFAVCSHGGSWSSQTPTCEGATCTAPSQPQNGNISPQLSTYQSGQQVTFQCNIGFQLIGDAQATCVAGNTWSNQPPICQAISCMPPAQPENGNISPTLSSYAYQQQVVFSCSTGYNLVGDASIVCNGVNSWSNTVPTCQEITCTSLPQPQNGRISPQLSSYGFGQEVRFECNSGYQLVGSTSATCTDINIWSSVAPECQEIRCAAPAQPQNGNISPSLSSYTFQQEVTYSCNRGFYLNGEQSIRCTSPNIWSIGSLFPTCVAITCNRPADPPNGYILPALSVYAFEQEITFRCFDGYLLTGETSATCLQTNIWSNVVPTCQELTTCEAPVIPINGNIVPISLSYEVGEVVTFHCNTDHRLSGDETVTCLETGSWSNLSPTCQVITCSPPLSPANGQISPVLSSYSIGQQVEFQCNNGYQLSGQSSVYCLQQGQWSSESPVCQELLCSMPIQPNNGNVSPLMARNPIGTQLQFTCLPGYQISGPALVVCIDDGTWSTQFPRCVLNAPTSCISPPPVFNGNISPSLATYAIGTTITYTCNPGYDLAGTAVLDCTADGSWSAIFPTCILHVTCPQPVVPASGGISPSAGPYDQGQQVVFNCNPGHQLSGVPAVVCQSNGMWDEDSPQCIQETCLPPTIPANGFVVPSGPIPSGSRVNFACNSGYRRDGPSQATCLSSLEWSMQSPNCVGTCLPPVVPPNGYVNPSGPIPSGATVTFGCNAGYRLQGSAEVTCSPSTVEWDVPSPTCVNTCPLPVDLRNINVDPSGPYLPDTHVIFSCSSGFQLEGSTVATCLPSLEWNVPLPTCIVIKCPEIDQIPNGSYSPSQMAPFPIGQRVTFECFVEYERMGPADIVCTLDGTWSDNPPTCEEQDPTCEMPDIGSNLIVVPQEQQYDIGQVITFACEDGFDINGENSAVCTRDRTWSVDVPTCVVEGDDLLSRDELQIIIWAVVPSVVIILIVLIVCCICCCRLRRQGRARPSEEQMIMAYVKENPTFPSAQGTDIYNVYGERDNRPMNQVSNNLHSMGPQGESHYQRSLQRTRNPSHGSSHQSLPRSNTDSHHSVPRSSGLPAAESTAPSYANLDPQPDSPDRRQHNRAMNQLTRV